MWNLIVSTLVFIIAAWYIRRYLEEHGIPKGMTRGILIFAVASLLSWGAGEVVDWAVGTPPDQSSGDISQILKSVGQ
jgi:hypothetical protein